MTKSEAASRIRVVAHMLRQAAAGDDAMPEMEWAEELEEISCELDAGRVAGVAYITLAGFCPMGCGETLYRSPGGFIMCAFSHCPSPDAAAEILGERETEHLITFTEASFSVKHPLRERLNDELLSSTRDPLGHWHFDEVGAA